MKWRKSWILPVMLLLLSSLVACGSNEAAGGSTAQEEGAGNQEQNEAVTLKLPALQPAGLSAGERLRVVATTSIIGDVVAHVGGDAIELTTLMAAGQDPHSYEPAAQDLTVVARAHVIFVNGWNLEEGLTGDLETIGEDVPVVPVSASIVPLAFSGRDGHSNRADPHVWLDVHNVKLWVENIVQVLSDLDPANARTYENNATVYLAQLEELEGYIEAQLGKVPAEKRLLVTNHDSLNYFAHAYDFEIVATVIPSSSTMAEPSASDLAALISTMEENDICTIFTETTVSDRLASTVAAELEGCAKVQVLPLFTGALGSEGSNADSYITMMEFNVDTIVAGLSGS